VNHGPKSAKRYPHRYPRQAREALTRSHSRLQGHGTLISSQISPIVRRGMEAPANLAVLSDLSGIWIDRVHERKKPKIIVLDMDSSESPTHGDQEGSAYNGHAPCATVSG